MRKRIALPLLIVIWPGQKNKEEKKKRDGERILVLIVLEYLWSVFIRLLNKAFKMGQCFILYSLYINFFTQCKKAFQIQLSTLSCFGQAELRLISAVQWS